MQRRTLNQADIEILILLTAILFGGLFRLIPSSLAGFPVNDGGMFYSMIVDLQANHYALPEFTTYNNLFIPFAYPPLGFYLGAFLSSLFNIAPEALLTWLPGILSTLCVPAIFVLAKEIFKDRLKAAVAALFFAVTPHMSAWLSMGGGLTRSLGTFFMLLTITFVYRLYNEKTSPRWTILWVILFAGLTILSHTESAVFAVAISFYILLWKLRSWDGVRKGALVSVGVFILASPWLGAVLSRHGIEPFLSALQTGGHSLDSILRIININAITGERYLDLLGAVGVLGFILLIARGQFFIPLLLVVIQIAQPRSAHTIGNIPLALAGAFFIVEILIPNPKLARAFLAVTLPFILMNNLHSGFLLSNSRVSADELNAMEWIDHNLPEGSTFLVINGETAGECDALTEWFPSIAKRTSVATMQGREWLIGDRFVEFIARRDALQRCMDSDLNCLLERSQDFDPADYIFISVNRSCSSQGNAENTSPLLASLRASGQFELIYDTDQSFIFLQSQDR